MLIYAKTKYSSSCVKRYINNQWNRSSWLAKYWMKTSWHSSCQNDELASSLYYRLAFWISLIARQVSLGHTWCLILSLVSVWSSPLLDMSVCPLLTSATAVFRISCWFLIVHLVKMFIYWPGSPTQIEWDSWAHNPGLTHLSLVHSPVGINRSIQGGISRTIEGSLSRDIQEGISSIMHGDISVTMYGGISKTMQGVVSSIGLC